eukprot:snap_masked-scaffold_3-processed-gene-3.38-mRNA-1 protein AED:1.00 eAED:1.00 QI:0/0/0/0/1/1/3/0/1668
MENSAEFVDIFRQSEEKATFKRINEHISALEQLLDQVQLNEKSLATLETLRKAIKLKKVARNGPLKGEAKLNNFMFAENEEYFFSEPFNATSDVSYAKTQQLKIRELNLLRKEIISEISREERNLIRLNKGKVLMQDTGSQTKALSLKISKLNVRKENLTYQVAAFKKKLQRYEPNLNGILSNLQLQNLARRSMAGKRPRNANRLGHGFSRSASTLREVERYQVVKKVTTHFDSVYSVKISPNQKWLATGSDDYLVKIFLLDCMELYGTLKGHTGCICDVQFLPLIKGREYLTSCALDYTIRIWSVQTTACIQIINFHTQYCGPLEVAKFSGDNLQVVSTSDDGLCCLWEIEKIVKKCSDLRTLGQESVEDVDENEFSEKEVSPSEYITHLLEHRENGEAIPFVFPHFVGNEGDLVTSPVNCVSRHPDRSVDLLATGSNDGRVRLWLTHRLLNTKQDIINLVKSGEGSVIHPKRKNFLRGDHRLHLSFQAHKLPVTQILWSREGERLLTGCLEAASVSVWTWDLFESELGSEMSTRSHSKILHFSTVPHVRSLIMTPTEELKRGIDTLSAKLYPALRSTLLGRYKDYSLDACCWNQDSTKVITMHSGKSSQKITKRSVETNVRALPTQFGIDLSDIKLTYIPDSFETSYYDSSVMVFCAFSGLPLYKLRGHRGSGTTIRPHPIYANIVCTLARDAKVCFWDISQGKLVHSLLLPSKEGLSYCLDGDFSKTGERFILGDSLGRISILSTFCEAETVRPDTELNQLNTYYVDSNFSGAYGEQFFPDDVSFSVLKDRALQISSGSVPINGSPRAQTNNPTRVGSANNVGSPEMVSKKFRNSSKFLLQLWRKIKTTRFGPLLNLQRRQYSDQPPERNVFFATKDVEKTINMSKRAAVIDEYSKTELLVEQSVMSAYQNDFVLIDAKIKCAKQEDCILAEIVEKTKQDPSLLQNMTGEAELTTNLRQSSLDSSPLPSPLPVPRRSTRQIRSTRNEDMFEYGEEAYSLTNGQNLPRNSGLENAVRTRRGTQRRAARRAEARISNFNSITLNLNRPLQEDPSEEEDNDDSTHASSPGTNSHSSEFKDPTRIIKENNRRRREEKKQQEEVLALSSNTRRSTRAKREKSYAESSYESEFSEDSGSIFTEQAKETSEQPKDLDYSCDRSWLRTAEAGITALSYVPQQDDVVVICLEGLMSFLEGFFPERVEHFQTTEFKLCTKSSFFFLAKVESIQYKLPDKNLYGQDEKLSLIARTSFRITAVPRMHFYTGIVEGRSTFSRDGRFWSRVESFASSELSFHIDLFPHSLPEFIIAKDVFESSLSGKIYAIESAAELKDCGRRHYFVPFKDDKNAHVVFHICQILQKGKENVKNRGSPITVWKCLKVKYPNWDYPHEWVSPWEVWHMYHETAAKVNSSPTPHEFNERTINPVYKKKILNDIKNLKKNPRFELFFEPVDLELAADYLTIVNLHMDVNLIHERILKDYYRQEVALLEDISLIYTNSVAYNGKDHEITLDAKQLTEALIESVTTLFNKKNPWILQNLLSFSSNDEARHQKLERLRHELSISMDPPDTETNVGLRLTRGRMERLGLKDKKSESESRANIVSRSSKRSSSLKRRRDDSSIDSDSIEEASDEEDIPLRKERLQERYPTRRRLNFTSETLALVNPVRYRRSKRRRK